MELSDEEVQKFMSLLLDELNAEFWGDIEPDWLANNNEDSDAKENHESLKKIFKSTFKKFKNDKK